MRARTFLLLSFIFSLLQGPFLPPVFSEGILLVFLVIYNRPRKFLPALLLAGLLFDLLQSQTLGATSLIFILASAALFIIKDRVLSKRLVFWGIFAGAVNLVRAKIVFGILPLPPAIVAGVILVLVLKFFWQPQESEYRI